jgi:hypothetical protein
MDPIRVLSGQPIEREPIRGPTAMLPAGDLEPSPPNQSVEGSFDGPQRDLTLRGELGRRGPDRCAVGPPRVPAHEGAEDGFVGRAAKAARPLDALRQGRRVGAGDPSHESFLFSSGVHALGSRGAGRQVSIAVDASLCFTSSLTPVIDPACPRRIDRRGFAVLFPRGLT